MINREAILQVIGGHCSFSNEPGQLEELHAIANIQVPTPDGTHQRGVHSVRFVTLKSCTNASNPGIGMDAQAVDYIITHPDQKESIDLPGIKMSAQFAKEEGVGIGAEIMIPHIQMPQYERHLAGKASLFPWIPSSVILGWVAREMDFWCQRTGGTLGIKNPKWLGSTLPKAEDSSSDILTSMQRSWDGMETFTNTKTDTVFINRGVDVPEKGTHRNAITHEIARRIKRSKPHRRMGIDLNHACGPNHRDEIAPLLVQALLMTVDGTPLNRGGIPLYDVLLAEVGTTSITDSGQHMSIPEFSDLLTEVSKHRPLLEPRGLI